MTSAIWSLPKLEELLNNSEPSVQEWAAAKLFSLYPEEGEKRLPWLLADERPAIVMQSLNHLGKKPREELVPLLRRLYVAGDGALSARAVTILGDWQIVDGVDWIKERILQKKPLAAEQIIAMIYALGRIPSEEAYNMLKQTEKSIQEKDSNHWQLFYSSLLRHHKIEDVQTLLGVILDKTRREERRREALGLLLGEMDVRLNPSDAFFVNHSALQRYWLERLEAIEAEARGAEYAPQLSALKAFILWLTPDLVLDGLDSLKNLPETTQVLSDYPMGIFHQTLDFLSKETENTEWHYGLVCLAISALMAAIDEKIFPPPPAEAHWKEKAAYLLQNRPPKPEDDPLEAEVIREANQGELIALLSAILRDEPESWGALRAVDILGELKAQETAPDILRALSTAEDDLLPETVQRALPKMGVAIVPLVLPLLDSTNLKVKSTALNMMADLPTQEGVNGLIARFASLYTEYDSFFLETISDIGSADFLKLLEEEYRPGEAEMGKAYVHICRVNGLEPPLLHEIERVVKRADAMVEEQRRILSGDIGHWPTTVQLELACKECGKKYSYEIREVHLHPHAQAVGEPEADMTPYKQGLVIADDVRCKNCGAFNRVELTAKTMAQLTAESVKIIAFRRSGVEVPSTYPVKHVQVGEREGEPLTLADVEREHLNAVELAPGKPGVQVALGKFYEYVKEFPGARQAYLRALDSDARALEAMAGLARLAHAEGDLEKAVEWIEDCYENLESGKLYVAKDASEFKKAVREKRREYARESGVKLEDKPVKIRFSMDEPDYPKNRPCPCGSGKKYKLCCMKAQGSSE